MFKGARILLLTAALAVGCDTPETAHQQHPHHLTFAEGRLSFEIPVSYTKSHDKNGTITITAIDSPEFALHIDVQDFSVDPVSDADAASFIRFQAQEIGAHIHELGNLIYFTEQGVTEEGRTIPGTHWQVAVEDFLVIMTHVENSHETSMAATERAAKLVSAIIGTMKTH